MLKSKQLNVYKKVYSDLVKRLSITNINNSAQQLGLAIKNNSAVVPFLKHIYLVGRSGVFAIDKTKIDFTYRIILAHYLLNSNICEPAGRFIPYRDLPGGSNFSRYVAISIETRLAKFFSGQLNKFNCAAIKLGGMPLINKDWTDAAYIFIVLPKLPIMITFYDIDDDFPADAKLFYDLLALNFLDLECLAVLGFILITELEIIANDI